MVSPLEDHGGSWEQIEGTRGDLRHAPISDAHGQVEIAVPPDTALSLDATSEDEGCGYVTVEVARLSARERREVVVDVPCGNDRRYFARLLDRETGSPVPGAAVQLMRNRGGSEDAEGKWIQRIAAVGQARTDATGRFDVSLASWMNPHLRIEAEGYGLLLAGPHAGHEDAAHAEDLLVSRGGTLRGLVVDAAGKPMADTALVLEATGYKLDTGGQDDVPGEWIDYPSEHWRVDLDATGRCVVAGLPARVEIEIEVRQGKAVLRRDAQPLELQPGQVVERTWTIGAGTRIEGSMVDQRNNPVAKHEVWLLKRQWPGEKYVDAYERTEAAATAKADAQGRFTFEDVVPGPWWLCPAATRGYGDPVDPDGVAPKTQTIEVLPGAVQSVTLVVTRGLVIRGSVLDPDGQPVDGAYVGCTQVGEWVNSDTHTGSSGAFVLGPLSPGTCTLWADGRGATASSDTVEVEPGQENVVLRLRAGGRITGRVVDPLTGKPCPATVHVRPEHPRNTPMGGGFETETREEGAFKLENLEPDRYHLLFSTGDGRFATLSAIDVVAGQESSGHVVSVTAGGKVRIRYEGKVAGIMVTIAHEDAHVGWPFSVTPDKAEVRPVPAGRLVIEYALDGIGVKATARTTTIDVTPGETREIVLKDDG
jgi:protocatechuate 3,4-dioxygenase beta subunit